MRDELAVSAGGNARRRLVIESTEKIEFTRIQCGESSIERYRNNRSSQASIFLRDRTPKSMVSISAHPLALGLSRATLSCKDGGHRYRERLVVRNTKCFPQRQEESCHPERGNTIRST